MKISVYIKVLIAAAALLTLMKPSFAAKLEDRDWNEIKSENFTIYSMLAEDQAADLLHNLELLRAAVPVLTNIQITEPAIPTVIISVKSASDLRKFGISNRFLGVFVQGLRNNLILVRDSKFTDGASTILHEYVHFITRNGRTQDYPRWFSEGFAEYFSSAALNGDSFEVGRFPTLRRSAFRNCDWVAIKHIISNSGRNYCLFYPASWATVHYIQTLPNHAAMMADYLRQVESGEDSVDAFVSAFGVDITTFDSRVRRYVKKGKFSYIGLPADKLISDFKVSVRPMFREETSLLLGNAALRMGEHKRALRWFQIAVNDEEFAARAYSGLGDVHKYGKDYAAAEKNFDMAVTLAPEDTEVLLDMGEYWLARARTEKDTAARDRFLKAARKYIGKSWKLDDTKPETYAVFGRSYMIQEQFEKSLDTLEAANRLLPSYREVRLDLARSYIELGRLDDARFHAQAVRAWSHEGSSLREKADKLIEQMKTVSASSAER